MYHNPQLQGLFQGFAELEKMQISVLESTYILVYYKIQRNTYLPTSVEQSVNLLTAAKAAAPASCTASFRCLIAESTTLRHPGTEAPFVRLISVRVIVLAMRPQAAIITKSFLGASRVD